MNLHLRVNIEQLRENLSSTHVTEARELTKAQHNYVLRIGEIIKSMSECGEEDGSKEKLAQLQAEKKKIEQELTPRFYERSNESIEEIAEIDALKKQEIVVGKNGEIYERDDIITGNVDKILKNLPVEGLKSLRTFYDFYNVEKEIDYLDLDKLSNVVSEDDPNEEIDEEHFKYFKVSPIDDVYAEFQDLLYQQKLDNSLKGRTAIRGMFRTCIKLSVPFLLGLLGGRYFFDPTQPEVCPVMNEPPTLPEITTYPQTPMQENIEVLSSLCEFAQDTPEASFKNSQRVESASEHFFSMLCPNTNETPAYLLTKSSLRFASSLPVGALEKMGNTSSGETPLYPLIRGLKSDQEEFIRHTLGRLFLQNFDLKSWGNSTSGTLLAAAIDRGDAYGSSLYTMLIEAGHKLDTYIDSAGNTPLTRAIESQKYEHIFSTITPYNTNNLQLLARGANVNFPRKDQLTPLQVAFKQNPTGGYFANIINGLIKNGADPFCNITLFDNTTTTPLAWAAEHNMDVLNQLLKVDYVKNKVSADEHLIFKFLNNKNRKNYEIELRALILNGLKLDAKNEKNKTGVQLLAQEVNDKGEYNVPNRLLVVLIEHNKKAIDQLIKVEEEDISIKDWAKQNKMYWLTE